MPNQRARPDPACDRDARLLHDLRSLLGIVHAQAVDARRALSDGEDPTVLLDELVGLSALAVACLRGLERNGLATRPFDLRAAAFLARLEHASLTLGLLYRAAPVDARAGALVDLLVDLARALGASVVTVVQDEHPGLRFEPSPWLASDAARAAADLASNARALGLALAVEDGGVRLRPR